VSSTPAIFVRDLSVVYPGHVALENVTFEVPQGVLAGLVGPNGAGKSTLLKAVLGLVPRVSGEVYVFGKPYETIRHRVAYVPQREEVDWDFPVTVRDVVLMGRYGRLGLFRRPGKDDFRAAEAALKRVGMEKFRHRQIGELSGGQRQRIFIARALAQEADLYFLDEPFAGVDAASERAILEVLRELRREGKTIFVVHHDLQTVREYFDWIVVLNRRVIAAGPLSLAFTSKTLDDAYGGRLLFLDRLFSGEFPSELREQKTTLALAEVAANSPLQKEFSAEAVRTFPEAR